MPTHRPPSPWKRLTVDGLIFITILSTAGFLWGHPLLLTLIYAAVGLFLLWSRWSPETASYYLIGFLLGPAAEYFAVRHGAWTYMHTEAVLPLWLPFGWGIAALYLKSTGDLLSQWATAALARFFTPNTARPAPASGGRNAPR